MLTVFRVCWRRGVDWRHRIGYLRHSADRRLERDLIAGYEKDVATVRFLASLSRSRWIPGRIVCRCWIASGGYGR